MSPFYLFSRVEKPLLNKTLQIYLRRERLICMPAYNVVIVELSNRWQNEKIVFSQ